MLTIGAEVTWQRDPQTGEWKITPAEKNPQPKERSFEVGRRSRNGDGAYPGPRRESKPQLCGKKRAL